MDFSYLRAQDNKSNNGFKSPEFIVPTHRFIYVKKGTGYYLFDDQKLEATDGTIFITTPGNRSIHFPVNQEVNIQVINFTAPSYWLNEPFIVFEGEQNTKEFIAHIILDLIYGEDRRKDLLLKLLIDLYKDQKDIRETGNIVIKDKAKFIKENPHLTFSIKELAKECGCSESHFRRLFKQEMGLSPKNFIIKTKMHYGYCLMVEEKLYVKEVAAILGYNIHEFSKQFKNIYKKSPTKLISKK